MLRAYAAGHVGSADVALELPTGSGKTLVGFLIAEWRRLKLGERVAFVCPTNQLARQIYEKAEGYGVKPVLLVGPSDGWDPADVNRFQQGDAVAVTNYHHIFNRTPRIDAQALILDDSHTAEGAVAARWSLRLRREEMREAYMAVLEALGDELPKSRLRALRNEGIDPAHAGIVEVVLPDGVHRVSERLAEAIGPAVEGTDEWYAWDAIGAQLETCLVYASWSEILIRPFVAPTFTQDSFSKARQRVYLSATMGAGGELERSFGHVPIERIPQPLTWDREGSGRRFMLAPSAGRDGGEANRLIQEIVEKIGRVLFLAPSRRRIERAAHTVIPDEFPRLRASDIEASLTPFTSTETVALLLANRYDGIDLPGEACRLIVLSGRPAGTHLQERFLDEKLGAEHALAERIRTRITQGVGRATRSRRDTAVVVLHGDDLIRFLTPRENRETLRSELQAELEIALSSTATLSAEEILENVDSFFAQDEGWQPTEQYLRKYAEDHPQKDPPGAEQLAAAVRPEVTAWREAWRGNYDEAVAAAQQAAAALNHPTMSPYRAWWVALAASWSTIASGADAPRTVELRREADLATRRLQWRPRLQGADGGGEISEDDALALRADRAARWLRGRYQSPKLEQELTSLEADVEDTDATRFEMALEALGGLLGFEAERPAKQAAAPDGAWRDGTHAWIVWEAKSEEDPSGEISVEETRQANSHGDWVRHNFAWDEPEREIKVLVTPREAVHPSAGGVASDGLYRVHPSTVAELARSAVDMHRQLAGEIVGINDQESAERMAAALKAKKLDTPELIARLSVTPLRNG